MCEHSARLSICCCEVRSDTYQLLKHTLVERLFWLPASVELLVVLLETLEVRLPFLATAVAQLLDTTDSDEEAIGRRTEWPGLSK